jgi:hypothetical protein
MIDDSLFNVQQQANEISNGTSNSTQWCPTIDNKMQIQMKVLWTLNMQVLMLYNFLSFFYFLFFWTSSHWKYGIFVPSFEAKEKINFRIVQLKSMVVKSKYGSHD